MDLEVANFYGDRREPDWFELYRAKNEYELSDLSPTSMDSLFNRMLVDSRLFSVYFK